MIEIILRLVGGFAAAAAMLLAGPAIADRVPGSIKDEPARYDDNWWKDVKFSGHIEAGYTYNGANPADGLNFGRFVTLEGAEVIDACGIFFYSHTYIFDFGIPFKHTGILTTTHVSPLLDLHLGVTTGVNTTFGRDGDNNDAIAFHGGIGLNLLN